MSDDPFAPKIAPNADPFAPKPQSVDAFASAPTPAPDDSSFSGADASDEADSSDADSELSDKEAKEAADAIIGYVATMRRNGMSKEDAVKDLVDKGFPEEDVTSIVENIYSLDEEVIASQAEASSGGRTGGVSLAIGIFLLALGTILTLARVGNAIWYGAILVGVIEIIRGIVNLIRGK